MAVSMKEAFERNQAEIARRVTEASERVAIEAQEHLSIATWLKRHDNGAITIGQPHGFVTLTASQKHGLLEQIALDIGREQVGAVLS